MRLLARVRKPPRHIYSTFSSLLVLRKVPQKGVTSAHNAQNLPLRMPILKPPTKAADPQASLIFLKYCKQLIVPHH